LVIYPKVHWPWIIYPKLTIHWLNTLNKLSCVYDLPKRSFL
jgi:hypothetical protein